jgi:hypothetical protein
MSNHNVARLTLPALLGASISLFVNVPAVADVYPVSGVWAAPNAEFPIAADEACFTIKTLGVEAVAPQMRALFAADTIVVADGTSCRHQIRDGTGRDALHVARVLAMSVNGVGETAVPKA